MADTALEVCGWVNEEWVELMRRVTEKEWSVSYFTAFPSRKFSKNMKIMCYPVFRLTTTEPYLLGNMLPLRGSYPKAILMGEYATTVGNLSQSNIGWGICYHHTGLFPELYWWGNILEACLSKQVH